MSTKPGTENTSLPHLDDAVLEPLKMIMEESFSIVLDAFIQKGDSIDNLLTNALQSNDFDNLVFHAHTFKGSSGNIGAAALSYYCGEIEQRAKNNSLEGVPELISKIADEYQVVKALLL